MVIFLTMHPFCDISHMHDVHTACTHDVHTTYTLHVHTTYTLHVHTTYTRRIHTTYTLHVHTTCTHDVHTTCTHDIHTTCIYAHIHTVHNRYTCGHAYKVQHRLVLANHHVGAGLVNGRRLYHEPYPL